MNRTNLIHATRAKKQTEVIRSLEQTFTGFAYPVYLFGSFANGNFHGYSDIDLVILVSKQQAKQAYNEACDKLAGFNTPYDILTCQSVDELDNTIQSSLQPINNPQRSTSNRKYQQGMTLIEIMIALLIGAFLLGGILHIFINSKQTYRMQEGLSRMQENGRFAMSFLERDIRMAGFWGCHSTPSPNIDIAGTDNNAVNGDNIDNGTDTLIIKGAFSLSPTNTCSDAANSANSCGVGVNCYTDASSTITYKINNSVLQKDADGVVEGIENMQILYGEDTNADGTPNYYVAAGTVGLNMAQVVSVRISLTARTLENTLTSTGDGRLRRNFTSTIAIRNRLP